jgi:hypothetical protein
MSRLRTWYLNGRPGFVAAIAGTGAVAGVAAWALTNLLRSAVGSDTLDVTVLLFAVLRGALFGAILALILAGYWEWVSRRARRSGRE